MVEFSFGGMIYLDDCPVWWRHFVEGNAPDDDKTLSEQDNQSRLRLALAAFGGDIATTSDNTLLEALRFESEELFTAFKVYWTLHG
jgi:hypothetical protein